MQPQFTTRSKRRSPRPAIDVTCPVCRKVFKQGLSKIERGYRHCSAACRSIADNRPLSERFWARVQRSDGCWIWTGGKTTDGYGIIRDDQKHGLLAHRVSYQLMLGSIPAGYFVCHRCDNPSCVRPDHLFLGKAADNAADMVRKGRSAKGDAHSMRLHPDRICSGDRNHCAKFTNAQVLGIRRDFAAGLITAREVAIAHHVDIQTVQRIVQRRTWRHI